MLIYIFVEHFPNPYKPYIDSQLVYLLNGNHNLKIFAGGKYTSSLNKEVLQYNLDKLTTYQPNTLRDLPKYVPTALLKFSKAPLFWFSTIKEIFLARKPLKEKIINATCMLLMPKEQPDLCLLHNLTTVSKYGFLKQLYGVSKIALYYHGGEIPRQIKLRNASVLFSEVDHVFTCTQYSKNDAISRGCDADKIVVVPVGFNIDKYPLTVDKQYKQNGVLRLISIGRLSEEKGFMFALQALKLLVAEGGTNIRYTIVGSGYLQAELYDYVDKAKLNDYVVFAGEMTNSEVIKQLSLSDALVLPSVTTEHCRENQACVVQEALLMQLVVISTQIGGVQESIPDELKRFSVPERDANELAKKIKMADALTQDKFTQLGSKGRSYIMNRYAIAHVTASLLNGILKLN